MPTSRMARSDRPIWRLLLIFCGVMMAVSVATYWVMLDSQQKLIEQEALAAADMVTTQVLSARSTFTAKVIKKLQRDGFDGDEDFATHPGFVPIPAQYLRFVGEDISQSSNGLFRFKLLSRWNLNESQGLRDDFQRWAWRQFEAQDQVAPSAQIGWTAHWRIEEVGGQRTLRYMRADPADQSTCVECHNRIETTESMRKRRLDAGETALKQFKLHQLLGAIEVQVPIAGMESMASRNNEALIGVLLASLAGLGIVGYFALRSVHEERTVAGAFARLANVDALTKLGNRAYFEARSREITQGRHRANLAVIFVDLDGFKPINDTHGHAIGDLVLQVVARRLQSSLRADDVLTRQGGDEFVLLLRGDGRAIDVAKVAEKLVAIIAEPIHVEEVTLQVHASIGAASSPDSSCEVATLVERADKAMYAAKEAGGNCYRVWSEEG